MRITDEMIDAGARVLVRYALGTFEDQTPHPDNKPGERRWAHPAFTPNWRCREAARKMLESVFSSRPLEKS